MKLSALFSDHMVIQRNKPIHLWGEGTGKVCALLGGRKAYTVCDAGRWEIILPALEAGGPYTLTLCDEISQATVSDVMIGEVWLAAGQSNMEQVTLTTEGGFERAAHAENTNIRFFSVPRRTEPEFRDYRWHFESVAATETDWQLCTPETALHFSAIGFYFAELLQAAEEMAVGIISCNYGGSKIEAWIKKERIFENFQLKSITDFYNSSLQSLDMAEYEKQYLEYSAKLSAECRACDAIAKVRELGVHDFARISPINWPEEPPAGPHWYSWPGVLYRNMLQSIIPYSLSGVLWYQGESNACEYENYYALFDEMVRLWREDWNDHLPFLTVQIAPFRHWNGEIWPCLVEQQLKAAENIDAVAIVTSSDIGEPDNIHPLKKQVIAERLFLAAENIVFNRDVEYCGPVYKTAAVNGNKIVIEFSHAESGLFFQGEPAEIMIAGDDGNFKNANAETDADKLIVWSDEIPKPCEVRLGFTNYSEINLYNNDGHPAAPFRTGRITSL